jgi:hypothetical protein
VPPSTADPHRHPDPGVGDRPDGRESTRVVELLGIYHANGSLWGEVTYWVGARFGRAHCALCDITHGTFRRRPEWDSCAAGLPVPFTSCHLDDRPDDVVTLTDGHTPCVVARTTAGPVIIVDPETLETCHGDPAALVTAIGDGLDLLGFRAGEFPAGEVVPGPAYTSQSDVPVSETEESS